MPKRKQLTGAERIAAEIRKHPGWPDRAIAEQCGVSRQRVQAVRRQFNLPSRPIGAPGKPQYCGKCGEIFKSIRKLLRHIPQCE